MEIVEGDAVLLNWGRQVQLRIVLYENICR